ncbi:MAG: type II toxin-antitoxin system prevent-host-death family antitoxin [gamma proteobacterium symbiont of Taylorina sp.]|nr:type II toxin-antitoxin system prevent-host-death family antitoxin [gamma proteobacterium symbiont of Taylorina sp.]
MQATAKDLRFHSTELLNTVKRGEEVVISYHGKSCAKLVPIDDENEDLKTQNELFGIWKDNPQTQDVKNHVRNIRQDRFNVN